MQILVTSVRERWVSYQPPAELPDLVNVPTLAIGKWTLTGSYKFSKCIWTVYFEFGVPKDFCSA
jgi:hypothetical protein